jgi:hypothetical protein
MTRSAKNSATVKVYYGDGTRFSGPAERIPSPLGVMAVSAAGKVHHSGEYYVLVGGDWFTLRNIVDLIDHVLHSNVRKVLKGRWMPKQDFDRILRRAEKEADLAVHEGVCDAVSR